MMENDDKLIRGFFSEQKREIADNGFSRRVMHHLPDRQHRLDKVWTVFVSIVTVVLFFVFGGMQTFIGATRNVVVSMVQNGVEHFDPRTLIILVVVLGILGLNKAYRMI